MRQSNRHILILLVFTVALIFIGCNRNTIYSHYELRPLNEQGWEQTDTLYYNVPPVKTEGSYSEKISLRANSEYPFTELVVVIRQKVLPEGRIRMDTVTFHVTDTEGNNLGKGLNLKDYQATLKELWLHKGDSLSIRMTHYMRKEHLPGIMGLGLSLTLHAPASIDAEEYEE